MKKIIKFATTLITVLSVGATLIYLLIKFLKFPVEPFRFNNDKGGFW